MNKVLRVVLAIADIITALFATLGILSTLCAGVKTGKGQRVTTFILETTVGILTMQAGKYFATGHARVPGEIIARDRPYGG